MFPSYHTILDKYFTQCEGRHIIFHQIESFNTFMDIDIPEIIKNSNPIIVRGSPEVPLSGPRSALASATGLSTSAANALMGIAGAAGTGAGAGVTINEFMGPKYEYEVNMTFENLTFRKPTIFENNGAIQPMMPNDARLRNLTYASPLFVDVRVKTTFIDNTSKGERTERERLFPNVHMGKIPIMVGSKYCLLHDQTYVHPKVLGECAEDFGGYFIVSGGERVIISQERMSENRPFVFRNNKANNKDIEIIEVKSIGPDNDQVPKSNSVKIVYHPKNSQIHLLKANLPRIKSDIPLFILFRALGISNDRDIIHLILGEQEEYFSLFDESIQEASFIHNQEEAFIYIANEMNSSASKHAKQNTMKIQDLLHNELFPHVGLKDEDNYAKACFLAHMTRKLLWVSSSKIPNDDRDAYPNKRVDLPGFLLASLFRTYFNNKMVKDIRSGVSKEIHNGSWRASGNFEDIVNMSNINKIIKSVIMEIGLKTSLATGNFGSAKIGGPTKIGVSQVLNRLNYLAGVSHLRRVSTPIEKTGKLIAPRKLHNTGFGYICVTSDTHIIHGDGISTSKIIDMKDGDTVLTADSTTLIESSSEIYNYFKTTPTKVLKIKTLSGRTIGCSADHPLLVEKDGGFEWIHAGDLTIHDNLVVKNYTIPLSKDGTLLNIPFSKLTTTDTCSKRQNELKQLGFIDNDIDHTKMEILARLYGACVTDGHIATGKYGWTVSFYIGEESDAIAILEDIERLGFAKPRYGKKSSTYTNPETKKEVHYNYYVVNKGGAFATLLITLGCIVGKKGTCKNPIVPTWILNASQSVKREFLSGFQGGDGCRITMYSNGDGKNKVGINATQQTCSTEYADTHYSYIKSISELFTNLGIQSSVEQIHKEKNTIHLLKIKNNYENMGVYVKTIGYRYCAEKTRASALPIEYILYRNDLLTLKKENIYKIHELRAQGKTMDFIYQQMKSSMSLESVREFSNDLTKKCVPKCANSLSYNEFCKTTKQIDTRIIIGISEISEIAIETVYDFTTRSDNHDFYANGILVRNCPSETPEGHSVGVVKNLSSTASVSIYSNVNILKDYIKAHKMCIPLADSSIEQKYGLVRLFVNGAWIGSIPHENVMSCVRNLKKAKQAGKIHAFTGIIWKPQFKELWMTTEAGRLLRPLYCAETIREIGADSSGKLLKEIHDVKTWNELLLWCSPKGNQLIEYIDPGETECSYIAMKFEELEEDHTHMEIHPSTALGTLASNIPFPDHNQSPRNSYQCLEENELVLLENGSRIPIRDAKIGDMVVTFNPITQLPSPSRIINHYVRNTDKNIFTITTESGRKIVATEDHMFMTDSGWKQLCEMNMNTKVGIQIHPASVSNDVNEYTILDEEIVSTTLHSLNLSESLIRTNIQSMKEANLLPLLSTNEKVGILARIAGCLMSDGSMNIYNKKHGGWTPQVQANFGLYEDAQMFENDVISIGFKPVKIDKSDREFNGVCHHTFKISHNGAFASFMACLDITLGKYTEVNRKEIPLWIMNGSKNVKREFLASFQGGDGCKIRWNNMKDKGYNYICAATLQQISNEYNHSLVLFMKQMIDLFSEFDIETSFIEPKQIEINRITCGYKIRDTTNNLIKYFTVIGYKYDTRKLMESSIVIEYLKKKNIYTENHKKQIQNIRDLYLNEKTLIDISIASGFPVERVRDAIRSMNDGRKISSPNLKMKIEDWITQCSIVGQTLFVPIKSIEPHENVRIADITVESDNHSFVAGDNFAVHNCAMGKQAMGMYAMNFKDRFDTMAHVLCYPQVPFVSSYMSKFYGAQSMPCGQNVTVAIMTYTGYNQEDSVMLNRAALDRGLFRSIFYRTYKDEERKNQSSGEEEKFCRPDPDTTKQLKHANYSKLDEDGFVPENTYVDADDILIGKVVPIRVPTGSVIPVGAKKLRDVSRTIRNNETGWVDKIFKNRNGEGYSFVKVRVRQDRIPEIGDKFSSRHGQKGTLGMILNSEDMPQTASGIIPDIIINPHCFTEDHEILTSQGFKNMEEVNELYNSGKLIIGGYNHKTETLIYESASAVIIKDAPDTMIEFTQNESNVSLIVTPDHDMFATRDETLTWKDYKKEKAHTFLKQDGIIKFLSMPDNGSIVTTSFPEVVLQSTRDIKEITTYKGKVWCVSVPHGFVVARRATRDEDGIVTKASRPIIVGNCIPSRMTIAQFMETLLGKVSCEMGTLGDGSPFNDVTIEGLSSMLRDKMGLEPYGNEIMYNGFTGRMMETSIFTGPVYYQRLRHCSADKIHSRSSGPLVMLTRQPAEGRAREGGLRFGEMERDAVISHGISEFTKERFMECSDLFRCFTCRDCGLIAISNPKEGVWCCRGCGNSTSFSAIEIPYAYKLLLQELETMNITSRIITQSKLLKMEAHNVEDKQV